MFWSVSFRVWSLTFAILIALLWNRDFHMTSSPYPWVTSCHDVRGGIWRLQQHDGQYTNGGRARGGHRATLPLLCNPARPAHDVRLLSDDGLLVVLTWPPRLNGVSQYGEKTERNLFTTAQSGDIIWATTGRCSGTKFQPLYICLVMEAILCMRHTA